MKIDNSLSDSYMKALTNSIYYESTQVSVAPVFTQLKPMVEYIFEFKIEYQLEQERIYQQIRERK